jgi:putative ABC transport system permease protein
VALPLSYNVRSVAGRWPSTLVAVLGIAGTVAVFIAVLALARGFRATLIASGSPGNAVVLRAGATSEMVSAVGQTGIRVIEDAPGVAHSPEGPLVSAEVAVIAAFPLRETGTDANVQVRGVSPRVLSVRESVRIVEGRFFTAGLPELIVGRNAAEAYTGLDLGGVVRFGGETWTIVGIFDAGRSAFDSEIWGDMRVVSQAYHRPAGLAQSVTVRLESPAALESLREALARDPRMSVQVLREDEYYAKQSRQVTTLILVLGSLVTAVMGIGAVFGALNSMYSAVAERTREIAVLRALGFGGASVVTAFVLESLLVALAGGLLGGFVALPLNGFTTGTFNWQSFSHIAFAFQVTPSLVLAGVGFALAMGLLGGLPPAIRAARLPVATALRAL